MSDDEINEPADYKVGKNRPPISSRWPKGQSGNSRGRPKARKADQLDVAGILNSPVKAQIGGKEVKVSTFEASFRQTAKKAIEGDLRSIKRFLRRCDQFGLIQASELEQAGGVIFAPKGVDFQEWLDESTEWVTPDE